MALFDRVFSTLPDNAKTARRLSREILESMGGSKAIIERLHRELEPLYTDKGDFMLLKRGSKSVLESLEAQLKAMTECVEHYDNAETRGAEKLAERQIRSVAKTARTVEPDAEKRIKILKATKESLEKQRIATRGFKPVEIAGRNAGGAGSEGEEVTRFAPNSGFENAYAATIIDESMLRERPVRSGGLETPSRGGKVG